MTPELARFTTKLREWVARIDDTMGTDTEMAHHLGQGRALVELLIDQLDQERERGR